MGAPKVAVVLLHFWVPQKTAKILGIFWGWGWGVFVVPFLVTRAFQQAYFFFFLIRTRNSFQIYEHYDSGEAEITATEEKGFFCILGVS